MKKLPEAPESEVHWGIVSTQCETKMKEWIESVITMVSNGEADAKDAADAIFEEIRSLGYTEGYDNGICDSDPEGW